MPNYLKNWTYRDVDKFLKKQNFIFHYANGSHYYYIGTVEGKLRQVTVPYHGSSAINPRTMNSIIGQSGISKEIWFKK